MRIVGFELTTLSGASEHSVLSTEHGGSSVVHPQHPARGWATDEMNVYLAEMNVHPQISDLRSQIYLPLEPPTAREQEGRGVGRSGCGRCR